MKRFLRALALSSVPFVVASPGMAADQVCHLYQVAQFDMGIDDTGRVNVPMTINGQTVNLLVDTGGSVSTLTESEVSSLGLNPLYSQGAYETFYGGEVMRRYVEVHDANFGGIKGPRLYFFVMSDRRGSVDEGGTLAPDLMWKFDAEFDFANDKFNLFSQDHCKGEVVYWTKDTSMVAVVPFEADRDHHLKVKLLLDGKEIEADLDTGAWKSTGSLEAIEDEFNIDEKSPDLKLVTRPGDQSRVYHYPFKSLSFDGVAIYNPDIPLRPDGETHIRHKFLIGMNVLRELHLYIAYGEHNIYVTPATAR
jgi:hypothetical protein